MPTPRTPSLVEPLYVKKFSRRNLLQTASVIVATSALPPWTAIANGAPYQINTNERESFLLISKLLTSRKTLDPKISDRIYSALCLADPQFVERVVRLTEMMNKAKIEDMRDFKISAIEADPALRSTAQMIVKAWYLGYTGTPTGSSTIDDATFISYTGALMFEATKDITVIPTYARAGTNYWSEAPSDSAKTS